MLVGTYSLDTMVEHHRDLDFETTEKTFPFLYNNRSNQGEFLFFSARYPEYPYTTRIFSAQNLQGILPSVVGI